MNSRKVWDDVLNEAVPEMVVEMVVEDPSLGVDVPKALLIISLSAAQVADSASGKRLLHDLPNGARWVMEISDPDEVAVIAGEAFLDEHMGSSGKLLIHGYGLGGYGKVLHKDQNSALKTGGKLAAATAAALDPGAGLNQRILAGNQRILAGLYAGRPNLGTMPGSWVPKFREIEGNLGRLPGSPSWSQSADRLRAVAAQRLLLQLEEKRAVAAADAAGRSQVEIARDLGVSQPTVHRLLRQLAADPAVLQRGPLEVIASAVMGVVDRDTMLIELAALDPKPGESPPDAEAEGYVLGAWDEVVDAWERGWLTDDEYEYLARR